VLLHLSEFDLILTAWNILFALWTGLVSYEQWHIFFMWRQAAVLTSLKRWLLYHLFVFAECRSNFVRVDFRGFYIFILERGDEIIAAASVRLVFFLLPAVSCDYGLECCIQRVVCPRYTCSWMLVRHSGIIFRLRKPLNKSMFVQRTRQSWFIKSLHCLICDHNWVAIFPFSWLISALTTWSLSNGHSIVSNYFSLSVTFCVLKF
jgi:hypothetical protein